VGGETTRKKPRTPCSSLEKKGRFQKRTKGGPRRGGGGILLRREKFDQRKAIKKESGGVNLYWKKTPEGFHKYYH